MRKLFFIAAAAAAGFTATGAGATDFAHTVNLHATAPLACSTTGVTANSPRFTSVSEASSSLEVVFSSANILPQSSTLTFANMFCTGLGTTMTLTRTGLHGATPGSPPVGFKNNIPYEVNVAWAGSPAIELLGSDLTVTNMNVGARNGPLSLTVAVPPTVGPFVAEQYSDSLVLTLEPTT